MSARASATERDRRPVLLIVRSDDDSRTMYSDYLRDEGFTVLAAADGDAALHLAPQADLVITGLRLAGRMTGFELIDRLRRETATQETPIVVVTASVVDVERARAAASGCDLLLPMPCLPDELLRHVRRLVAR